MIDSEIPKWKKALALVGLFALITLGGLALYGDQGGLDVANDNNYE